MSLQATEATVVTFGEDNLIIRWVALGQCLSVRVACIKHPSRA